MKLPGQSLVCMDDSTAPVGEAARMSREILVAFPTGSNSPALQMSKPGDRHSLTCTFVPSSMKAMTHLSCRSNDCYSEPWVFHL